MSNFQRKSLIDLLGVSLPLEVLSQQEVEARKVVDLREKYHITDEDLRTLPDHGADIEPGYWYARASLEPHTIGAKSLRQEISEFPPEMKRKLSRISCDSSMVDQDVILSVRHLKKFFTLGNGIHKEKLKAVHDISFDVKKGEVFGLVGESGCGKTTTGRTLMRLYDLTSGSVYFMGYRIGAGSRWNEKEIKWKRKKGHDAVVKLRSDMREDLAAMSTETREDREAKEALKADYRARISQAQVEVRETVKEQRREIRQISYDEKHVNKPLLTKMQMIFQDPIDSLDPRMTVHDIIAEGLKIQGYAKNMTRQIKEEWDANIERIRSSDLPEPVKDLKVQAEAYYQNRRIDKAKDYDSMVNDALEKVGLLPEYSGRYPHEFSGGQRQRIGIARALIMHPELIIADEPISALDVSIRAQIINLLNDLREEMGLTIIFIAHDLSVVKYFCDRIAVMYYGDIVELASSDELFRHPLHPYTKSLLSAIPRPDPLTEKTRVRIRYNPKTDHDYSLEGPELQEILPGHFVLANSAEMERYREEIKEDDIQATRKAAEENRQRA